MKTSNKTINELVNNVIDIQQIRNNQHDDFNDLHQLLSDGEDKKFFDLLRSGHFNTDHGIPIGPNGETPLHLVSTEGRSDIIINIFDHKKQGIIDYTNALKMCEKSTGFTPILKAAMNGHKQCFEILLHQSIHCFETNSFNDNDILSCFTSDKKNIDHSSDDSTSNEQSTNLLHIIAQQNHGEILECLSAEAKNHEQLRYIIKRMLKAFDANGSTPLHYAARFGYLDMTKGLFDLADLGENPSLREIIDDKNSLNENQSDHQNNEGEDRRNQLDDTNVLKINRQDSGSTSNLSQRRSLLTPQIITKNIAKRLCGENNFSKTGATMILKQNKDGYAPIHEAVENGFKEIVVQFITVAFVNRQQIFTVKNQKGQTPLHLAALKGHADIVELILKYIHRQHITIQDNLGSTMFHCAAQISKENQEKSVEILKKFFEAQKKWITASEWQSKDFIEPLTKCNHLGYNCLEVAIIKGNRPFIKHILKLEKSQWEVLMHNAQINKNRTRVDTPMRKLIRYIPDLAYKVFSECVTSKSNDTSPLEEKQKVFLYDFQFLEDHCHVEQWDYTLKNNPQKPVQRDSSENTQSCWHRFLKKLPRISYYTSDRNKKFFPFPFHDNPNIVLHNHPLTIMKNQATLVNLNDETNVRIQTCLFEHPLCQELSLLKWKQFGFLIILITSFFYALFLGLFTWAVLRNIEPARFYDAVNASYGDGNCRMVYENLNARNESQINQLDHRKDTTDHALKYVIYILLWIHVFKSILCIFGVYQFKIRGRFYAEIVALILSFYYLYDDPNWQSNTRLRCFGQWQAGSFGLCLAWGTLLAYMRFIPYFGLYVVMLEVIIVKFLWFTPVLITIICSFAFSFYMLLQSELPFSSIGLAWIRTAFMLMDMNYEGRVFASDGSKVIVPYAVIFPLFILYAVILVILVNNLLIGLAVGEIPTLSQLSRLYTLIMRNELLNSCEVFRLRYLLRPSLIYFEEEKVVPINPNFIARRLPWFRKHFILRPNSSHQQIIDDLN